ncbi:MAG: hypothetical protein ACM3KE_04190 [Hyphomicrobiales bacterium]
MAKKRSTKTSSRFKDRICNLIPSRDTERDWRVEHAITAGVFAAPAAIPPQVDLRQAWWTVGDQSTTGSCVGWATADGVMRCLLVTVGRLEQDQLLSPRFVWMASKETDEYTSRPETFIEAAGTSLKAAMDIVRKYGVVLDSMLPFTISTLMYVGRENDLYAAAATRRAASYFNLGKDLPQWKSWLANNARSLRG